jgi:hypothetical protein
VAHLLRDCTYLAGRVQQAWAAEMADHLLAMHHAAQEWRLRGASYMPRLERDEWITHYARDPRERIRSPTSSC